MQIMDQHHHTASTRDPAFGEIAKARLHEIITRGVEKAGPVINRVLEEVPQDALVRGDALDFRFAEEHPGSLRIGTSTEDWGLHANAFQQVCSRAGIPTEYARKLRDGEVEAANGWQRKLLSHMLSETYGHMGGRYLVRSINGEARGFLSDKYRRLDSRPLLEAFVQACETVGARPYEGVASDTRIHVRAIVPEIVEPVPGEHLVFGLDWHNSDYGNGAYGVSAFALRLVCLNGLLMASAIKEVHLGARLGEEVAYSDRTYRLDTARNVSATRDVVRELMGPAAIERRAGAYAALADRETTWGAEVRGVRNTLTKAEQAAAKEAFDGEDTIMLPPGKTKLRFANALSWIANKAENPERRVELQALAGKVAA